VTSKERKRHRSTLRIQRQLSAAATALAVVAGPTVAAVHNADGMDTSQAVLAVDGILPGEATGGEGHLPHTPERDVSWSYANTTVAVSTSGAPNVLEVSGWTDWTPRRYYSQP
jgi:hypothetical protein